MKSGRDLRAVPFLNKTPAHPCRECK